jgi:hypothetical protein
VRSKQDATTVPLQAEGKTVEFQPEGKTVEFQADGKTVELPTARKHVFWRELAGAAAAGVVLLAAVVLVLETISWIRGLPGLGTIVLIGHLVGAVLAVIAQRQLDRRRGRPALLAGLGLGVVVAAVLILFWWS